MAEYLDAGNEHHAFTLVKQCLRDQLGETDAPEGESNFTAADNASEVGSERGSRKGNGGGKGGKGIQACPTCGYRHGPICFMDGIDRSGSQEQQDFLANSARFGAVIEEINLAHMRHNIDRKRRGQAIITRSDFLDLPDSQAANMRSRCAQMHFVDILTR